MMALDRSDRFAAIWPRRRRLRAERETERIFEMSPTLLAVAGFDGYLRRFNPAFEVFGYSREELLSRPWIEFAHPDDRERMMQAMASLERGEDIVYLENRVVCRDGTLRSVEWSTRVVPEQELFYAAGRDVTESRRAAREQAALRRVATLVAREAGTEEIFAAVGREVGEVLGVEATHLGRFEPDGTVVSVAQWGAEPIVDVGARFPLDGDSVSARVLRTGRSARMDGYGDASGVIAETVRNLGIRFSIGVPISIERQTWGVMIATSRGSEAFPASTEAQLQAFTDLVATAISNTTAHERARLLADEQAALRRVATLVARETPQAEVFRSIAEEVCGLLDVDATMIVRYDDERYLVLVAGAGPIGVKIPVGARDPFADNDVVSTVFRTGRAARIDDYARVPGERAERARALGIRSSVATPIMVEGRLWGAMVALSHSEPIPADTERRVGQFTELMATAIANSEARAEVTRLAAEQAALRRVATLVAQGSPPTVVFDAVVAEVSRLLDVSEVSLSRYDDDALLVLARHGRASHIEVGGRYPIGGENVTSTVLGTGRTARMDDYSAATGPISEVARRAQVQSVVAAPVVVEGRTWGVLAAVWSDRPAPSDATEERMARFAALLDTAIANADSRDQLTASRARVLAAGDDARRRVVRDLHDGAQQRLVHTVVTLKLAQRALREDPDRAQELIAEARMTAERATAEVRELAHGILPAVLAQRGLRAALRPFVSRLDVPVEVRIPDQRFPADIEASAYFIVAEALTNVVKHAHASHASVTATIVEGVLTLEVRDDGDGGADPEGHGLVGIGDRVDALGGRLEIESGPDGGTVLTARIPLST
jgi:PAS domain S-box-containing protein